MKEYPYRFELIGSVGSCEDETACWMSAYKHFVENQEWGDDPKTVSPVIRSLCIGFNDSVSPALRDRLLRDRKIFLAPQGTATTDADDRTRAYMCADWAVRVAAVFALRAAKLDEYADKLAGLSPVVDEPTASAASAASNAASNAASDAASYAASYAARYAARAASYAARNAASAASYAARNAASAASYAARNAASDAARAAGSAASDAASAARDAASDATNAASNAARDAASAARDAARDAARNAARDAASKDKFLEEHFLPLILKCCAVGKKQRVVITAPRKKALELFCKEKSHAS